MHAIHPISIPTSTNDADMLNIIYTKKEAKPQPAFRMSDRQAA